MQLRKKSRALYDNGVHSYQDDEAAASFHEEEMQHERDNNFEEYYDSDGEWWLAIKAYYAITLLIRKISMNTANLKA